jgi:hypothetical protein
MDGLDDQDEALARIRERDGFDDQDEALERIRVRRLLATQQRLALGISLGRDDARLRCLCEELLQPTGPIVTEVLVLGNGCSIASLALLRDALLAPHSTIRELDFVSLRTFAQVTGALACLRHLGKIRRLPLHNFPMSFKSSSEPRQQAQALARVIGDHVLRDSADSSE